MANLRQIALNGNAGAFVDILATVPARNYEAKEDELGNPVGIQVKSPLDNFATTNVFSFGSEPIQIPNFLTYPLKGRIWGMPAQGVSGAFNFTAATKLLSARSNAAGGTTLRVIEYE